jgi:hypothetical protein
VSLTSRIPSAITALAGLFQAAATIGQATPPVTVYDGPVVTDDNPQLVLWVGLDDPDSDGATLAASSDQTWAGLGKLARNEEITIECTAQAWSGTDDVAAMRTACYGIMSAVEDVVRSADASALGGGILFPDPGVTGGQLRQNATTDGTVAQVSFQVILKARIGG